ncbi:autotransporter [Escherichia coli]|uniref:Autotransporter n=1 Tax=Escherichia coli TaxID=562 RepID=A0A2X3K3B7_ECOLX|nr:autotransporter [Escherichia coli]
MQGPSLWAFTADMAVISSCRLITVVKLMLVNILGLGYYDQRSDTTLVVSDGGKISAPKISLSTNSELALGAQEGSAAKAAGIIDAEKIEFVWAKTSDKKITLNHTDKNATISAILSVAARAWAISMRSMARLT